MMAASIDYFRFALATVFAAPVDFVCSALPAAAMLNHLVNLRAVTFSALVPSSADFVSTVFYMKAGKFASFPPYCYQLLKKTNLFNFHTINIQFGSKIH